MNEKVRFDLVFVDDETITTDFQIIFVSGGYRPTNNTSSSSSPSSSKVAPYDTNAAFQNGAEGGAVND